MEKVLPTSFPPSGEGYYAKGAHIVTTSHYRNKKAEIPLSFNLTGLISAYVSSPDK